MLLASREDMTGGSDNLLQEIMEKEGRWFTGLDSCLWKQDKKHFISSLFFHERRNVSPLSCGKGMKVEGRDC